MTYSVDENAHAVFLPAFEQLDFPDFAKLFIDRGGRSVLLGESRSEYVARAMSDRRRMDESADRFRASIEGLRAVSADRLIIAVDQEMGGIQRLEGLVPDLPAISELQAMSSAEISARCYRCALAARELGITMFLAPIADILDGPNSWLAGRTLGSDRSDVTRYVTAYVEGVQRAGITAVTKHFPGYNSLTADPAMEDVSCLAPIDQIRFNLTPFAAAIAAGTKAIMTGPAPLSSLDPENAASTSPAAISLLRDKLGFRGLIVSDDLDAPATRRGRSLLETAIAALNAGAELLLVASGQHLAKLCEDLAFAARSGVVCERRLAGAAEHVRSVASGL